VYYVENALMLGLFGLACWDIVFMPLPGTFFNHFQSGPADLFTPDFHKVRQRHFESRFAELKSERNLKDRMLEVYAEKAGISNHLVHWGTLSEELLSKACEAIPREHLVTIFRRLCFDLRNNRSGFPDLVLFSRHGEDYRMVEVKGPGDRLQYNQRRWLRFFQQKGIPYEVVYVEWSFDTTAAD
jgi:hypothetical protein